MSNTPSSPTEPMEPSGDGDISIVAATATAASHAPPPPRMPADAEAPRATESAEHGRLRNRRLWQAMLSSIVIRPLSLLIPIVTVPLFYRYLGGAEGYGLYELVGSVAMYLGMTNLGLTMGLINKLTDCYVTGDRDTARRELSTMLVTLAAIALFVAVVCSFAVPLIPWRSLFNVKGNFSDRDIAIAVWVGCMVTVASLVTSLPGSVYFALQELHRSNLWEGVGKVFTLVACVLVVRTRWGIPGLLLAVSGTSVFVRLVNGLYMFGYEKRWLRPHPRLFDRRLLWATMHEGLLLFALQAANIMLFQMDKLIIGVGQDSAAVAGYSIIGRIYIAGYGVFMALLGPLWPASGEAIRRGDIAWVKRWQQRSVLLGCGAPLLLGVVLWFWGGPILRVYLRGQEVYVPRTIIAAVALTFATRAWVDCRSISLNSTGILGPQLVFYVGHAVLNLFVAIVAVRRFGVAGVAWSTPLTALLTSVWGYPLLMRKYIYSRQRPQAPPPDEVVPQPA